MKILLIAKTQVDLFPPQGDSRQHMPGKAEGSKFEQRVAADVQGGQELIEFAGRLCYESFHLPNKNTAVNSDYVQHIVALGHESVLEHASVTFYVEGVSRNLSHELIRHRHLSFSELSQRFVNMEDARLVVPPLWREVSHKYHNVETQPLNSSVVADYKYNVDKATGYGASRKEARQAARYTIPGGVETKFVVTGNLRAWRDVLKKRWSSHADAEIQELAGRILNLLYKEYPDVFGDITYE